MCRARDVGLLTTRTCSRPRTRSRWRKRADVIVIVCHMGLTTGGSIGAETLDDCVRPSTGWGDAARSVRSDVVVLVHGGPVAEPDDAQ